MIEKNKEKFIVANWKANLTGAMAERWLQEMTRQYRSIPGLEVILAIPFPFLFKFHQLFEPLPGMVWAAQDLSPFPLGSYTGAIPAALLRDVVEYTLVGHQERRRYFHETIQDVANKVTEALEEEITPIVCTDLDIARQQASAIEPDELEKSIVAYTPSDSEQLEISRSITFVTEGVATIASIFPGVPVLYGGGVNENNVAELLNISGLSGVMVASGCLDPGSFSRLLHNAGKLLAV